jgi:uncharacterized protein (DUF433 family)
MSKNELLERIQIDPGKMVGKPVIKGTRLTVQFILNLLSNGTTMEEILSEYDGLTREDILACLLFASDTIESISDYPLTTKAG